MALRLNVIIASTRPGRVGPAVAKWFQAYASEKSDFEVHLVDLADFELPIYNEPKHPRMQDYQHDHTKRWAESVVNAFTYVSKEWGYKPASFVSYGGASGGTRAADSTRTWFSPLKMMAIPEAIMAPMVFPQIQDGVFTPNDLQIDSADAMLKELHRWAEALKPLRA